MSKKRDRRGYQSPASFQSGYKSWSGMKSRCLNPDNPKYKIYGARGIKVCDRWMSFANFLADMGPRPAGLSIDRVDNDGNYEPKNCRWATAKEQRMNQRPKKLTADDVWMIRWLLDSNNTQVGIANLFNVDTSTISLISSGKLWGALC